jgi:hypothetical protein
MDMDTRTRLVNTLNFKSVDRLPELEWAGWWDLTIDRWHKEGLPAHLSDASEIREYFGMDGHRQWRFVLKKANCPPSPGVDHQTPPDVSLENYRIYLRLLNEYCRAAAIK